MQEPALGAHEVHEEKERRRRSQCGGTKRCQPVSTYLRSPLYITIRSTSTDQLPLLETITLDIMIASAIRRFTVAAPRFNPPSASVSQMATASSSSTRGRVAMMPQQGQAPVDETTSDKATGSAKSSEPTGLEDILTVGSVSSHCDGQKISRASEGSIQAAFLPLDIICGVLR